jgi:hypothetical protein
MVRASTTWSAAEQEASERNDPRGTSRDDWESEGKIRRQGFVENRRQLQSQVGSGALNDSVVDEGEHWVILILSLLRFSKYFDAESLADPSTATCCFSFFFVSWLYRVLEERMKRNGSTARAEVLAGR